MEKRGSIFKPLILIFLITNILLLCPIAVSDLDLAFDEGDIGINLIPVVTPPTNYSVVNTNSSDFWDSFDTPADFIWSSYIGLNDTIDQKLTDITPKTINVTDKITIGGTTITAFDGAITTSSSITLKNGGTTVGVIRADPLNNLEIENNVNGGWIKFLTTNAYVDLGFHATVDDFNATTISVSGEIGTGDGSSSEPSYAFKDDGDTGMWNPIANEIAFGGGTNEVMRINGTSKRVGIGTTNPEKVFEVEAIGEASLLLEDAGNDVGGGNFFFRTSRGGLSSNVNDYGGFFQSQFINDADEVSYLGDYWTQVKDVTDGSEDGDFYIREMYQGTLTTMIKMSGSQMFFPTVYNDDIGAERDLLIQADGQIGYDSSSISFKENIEDMTNEMSSKVYDLRPVTYDKISGQKDQIGLIAEEVNELFPEFISYKREAIMGDCPNSDGTTFRCPINYKLMVNKTTGEFIPETVNYRKMVVPLIQEVQNLNEKIEELEVRINKLEAIK